MQAVRLAGFQSHLFFKMFLDAGVVVVLLQMRDQWFGAPQFVQRIRNLALAPLIAAAIANEKNFREAVRLQAAHNVGQHGLERGLLEADTAWTRHMARGRIVRTFWHKLQNRCAQRVAKFARDRVAIGMQHVIVFAGHQPRTVGFHATRCNNRRRFAGFECVTDIHPRHLFHPHRVRCWQRIHGVGAVVRVVHALPSTHAGRSCWTTATTSGRRWILCR